ILFSIVLHCIAVSTLVSQDSSGSSTAPSPSISLPGSQSPFLGSEPESKATTEVLQIGFKEAIDRGLRNNLGLLIAGDQTLMARGERWKQLSELLPNVEAKLTEDVQTQSLTALGLKSSIFHAPVPRVVGPLNYCDARASLS